MEWTGDSTVPVTGSTETDEASEAGGGQISVGSCSPYKRALGCCKGAKPRKVSLEASRERGIETILDFLLNGMAGCFRRHSIGQNDFQVYYTSCPW